MSEALQQTRSLEVIGAEIRALTSSMLGNIIEIGRRMVEAKELLPHGEFGPWIKENTGYSHSTANNFMRLFEEYGARQQSLFGAEVENSQTFGKLSYTKALALLALPSEEEREAFVETHDVEAMSTRELQQALRERDEARKTAEAMRQELEGADLAISTAEEERDRVRAELAKEKKAAKEQQDEDRDTIRTLEQKITELESRPVDVAVQEPDPDVIRERAEIIAQEAIAAQAKKAAEEIEAAKKAAKAAKKTAAEEKKALEDKIELQKQKLDELFRKQAEVADAKTSVIYQEEIDRLKKQLAMSDADITTAKVLFAAWQEAYRKLAEAVDALPPETGDKLRAAMQAQAKAWAGADT